MVEELYICIRVHWLDACDQRWQSELLTYQLFERATRISGWKLPTKCTACSLSMDLDQSLQALEMASLDRDLKFLPARDYLSRREICFLSQTTADNLSLGATFDAFHRLILFRLFRVHVAFVFTCMQGKFLHNELSPLHVPQKQKTFTCNGCTLWDVQVFAWKLCQFIQYWQLSCNKDICLNISLPFILLAMLQVVRQTAADGFYSATCSLINFLVLREYEMFS